MQRNVFLCLGSCVAPFFIAGLLVAMTGCGESSAPPAAPSSTPAGAAPAVKPGATTATPHVEPMVPKAPADAPKAEEKKADAPKAEEKKADEPKAEEKKADAPKAEEKKNDEPKKEGAFLLKSESFGKIAQQAVPFPPAADLVAQADDYLEKIGGTLKDLDGTSDYKKDADAVIRDANGLSLIALTLGLSPEDNKYKKAAPGIVAAAIELEKVEKLDAANKAYEALKAAFASSGDPSTLGWTKVASLGPVMKAVPNLDSAVKRLGSTEKKLKKDPSRISAPLAGMAAIAQGSIANVKETAKPDADAEWKKECELFRDAAIKANATVNAFAKGEATYADYEAAYQKLAETCESCHKIFPH